MFLSTFSDVIAAKEGTGDAVLPEVRRAGQAGGEVLRSMWQQPNWTFYGKEDQGRQPIPEAVAGSSTESLAFRS